MQISGSFFSPIAASRLQIRSDPGTAVGSRSSVQGPSLRDFAKSVLELQDAHRSLLRAGKHYRAFGASRSASAGSSSSLGLSTTLSPTTLTSVEELNTDPTTFGPTDPDFAGSSSSNPTIGGQYSGENGDTTLTFTATTGGIVGLTTVRLQVRDSDNTLLQTVTFGFGSANDVFTLSNGLEVSLSGGTVSTGDSFQVEVSATVGESVRADNPFNGSGTGGANLDEGESVGTGTFEVNGTTIAVLASDSLNSVLDRINSSAAGVTASFDEETESVTLTQETSGPDQHVIVGNDTSGFLSAAKLDVATEVLGDPDETTELISDVAALSEIQSGNFTINGITLSVDVLQDSLADVLARINESSAGVTASFNRATGRVAIQSTGEDSLELQDEGTNLFSVFSIDEGTYIGENSRTRTRFRTEDSFRRQLDEFLKAYEKVFDGEFRGFGAATVDSIRTQLNQGVEKVFKEVLGKSSSTSLRSELGINFVDSGRSHRVLELDRGGLAQALKRNGGELAELLFAEPTPDGFEGLAASVGKGLERAAKTLTSLLGPEVAGLGLDVSA